MRGQMTTQQSRDVGRPPVNAPGRTWAVLPTVWLLWSTACGTCHCAEPHRFTAMQANGTVLNGNGQEVTGWGDTNAQPGLLGQLVFDASNPFRWLIDHSLPLPLIPDACIEFVDGDQLPGQVLEFSDGQRSPFGHWPAHLLVDPAPDIHIPANPDARLLRVTTRWVRRVIWKRLVGASYQPATVFLLDGSRVSFVSLRWSPGAIRLLTDDGLRTVFFSQIAEVHLPRQEEWQAYFEQLALLAPAAEDRLIQMETTEGLVATTSRGRFQATFRGDRKRPDHWYHMIQPAWSIDPLWVPHRTVRHRRFFQPHQVPLTLFTPLRVTRSSTFATAWTWQVNRSVQQSPLASATVDWGWGFGVHGGHELTFPLPPLVRQLRVRMGLDRIVNNGGCVQASVLLDGQPLFRSDVLIGSQRISNTGLLHLSPAKSTRNLTLAVDPVSDATPAGADPFDIRDTFDWGEPEVELDAVELKRRVSRQHAAAIPAFRNWQLAETGLQISNLWDVTDPADPRFRVAFRPAAPFLSCRRNIRIGRGDSWLSVSVTGTTDKPPHTRLQVRVDGRSLGEFAIPAATKNSEPVPLMLPVDAYRGRRVPVELCWMPGENASDLLLRSVSLLERRPGLLQVFEDDPQFAEQLNEGEGDLRLVTDEKHSGQSGLQVGAPGRAAAQLPGLNAAIRARPRLGEYRYLRFAWRKKDGQSIALDIGHDGRFGARFESQDEPAGRRRRVPTAVSLKGLQYGYRYQAGNGSGSFFRALRISSQRPANWTVVTRDLHSDMGDFNLTGLGLLCPDGNVAWFDHIYLARTPADLRLIPKSAPAGQSRVPADPNVIGISADPTVYGSLIGRFAPDFSTSTTRGDVVLYKQHAGRNNVLRVHPPAAGKPCVLSAPVQLATQAKTHLHIGASHEPQSDWQLLVHVNGKQIHSSLINQDSAPEGWADIDCDLSEFAGQTVLLEIHNHPNNWSNETAYFSRIQILESP